MTKFSWRRTDADEAVRARFDWETVSPSTAVVRTVAIAANTGPCELPPLYGALDPDALDDLGWSAGAPAGDRSPTVSFTFAGYEVVVYHTGTVVVRPLP